MKVSRRSVLELSIEGSELPLPVDVTLDDREAGVGNITIRYGRDVWSAGWDGMGKSLVDEFFINQDAHYLASKLSDIPYTVYNSEVMEKKCETTILKRRKLREIDSDEARELYDETHSFSDDFEQDGVFFKKVFGDFWRDELTFTLNPKYEQLFRIINIVQKALKEIQ